MTTIRRRLLLLLLPALAILMLIGGVVDYRVAVATTRNAYDRALANAALALAANLRTDEGNRLRFNPAAAGNALTGGTVYAIVGPDGALISGLPALPASAPASTPASAPASAPRPGVAAARPSFWDAQLEREAWRVASIVTPTAAGPVQIVVAETLERRAHTQQIMLWGKLLVDFAELDLTLLLVWIAVFYGLRPLDRLTADVERSPRELQRFDETQVPGELRSLIVAFNRLLELLRDVAQAQQRFVADAAHQMRTPVAGLLAQLELLIQEPRAAAVTTQLAAIQRGIQQLARSANQLLSLARAEPASALHENFKPVALKPMIEQLVERHLDRADNSGIDLGAEAADASIEGDRGLIEDLMENLLDNALKYTPNGGHVTVRSALDGPTPYLEVEDDGPGIPDSERARVRERFYRMPGSTGIGCGLGLSIVDEIARVHGAAFTIAGGANGRGARMRVRFDVPAAAVRL